ncbi:vitellogenin-6-like protein, partial [Dinothrombium tinctorium]
MKFPSTPIEKTVEKVNKLAETISNLYKSSLQETKIFEEVENILFDFRFQTPSEIIAAFKSEHNKADIKQRALIFFNILSVSTVFHKSFKITSALTEEYAQSSDSGLREYFIKLMAQYLSSQRILFEDFTVENGKQLFSFCYSDLVRSDKTLRKACLLYLSRVINLNCEFSVNCKRHDVHNFTKKYVEEEGLESVIPLDNSDLLLAIEVLSNFRSPLSKDFIKKILLNKEIDAIVRTEAAWALSHFNDPVEIQNVFKPLVYDRSEHLEIRVTAFLSVLLSMPRILVPFLMTHSYDNRLNFYENKQFLSFAFEMLKTFESAKFAMLPPYIRNQISNVYAEVKDNYERLLGETDTSKYIYLVESKNFFRIIFHVPSTSSLIPQKIFVRTFDAYSDYTLKVSFQGDYHFNMFDIFDQKEPENQEVKEIIDAIVNKFRKQSSPSKRKFSMSLMTDDYYTHLIYSDEASNQPETPMKFPFSFEFVMRHESFTDSAFPYFFEVLHSRIQKVAASPPRLISAHKAESRIIAFQPFSNKQLVAGVKVKKFLRFSCKLAISPDQKEVKIHLPPEGKDDYEIFFEERKDCNYMSKTRSLNIDPIKYESIDTEEKDYNVYDFGFGLHSYYSKPDDEEKENKMSLRRMFLDENNPDTLFGDRNFNYMNKLYLTPQDKPRKYKLTFTKNSDFAFTIKVDYDKEADNVQVFELHSKTNLIESEKTKETIVIMRNFESNSFKRIDFNITYPPQSYKFEGFKLLLDSIKDAAITGKIYGSDHFNLDVNDMTQEKYLFATVTRKASRREDRKAVYKSRKEYGKCEIRFDVSCSYRAYDDILLFYNKLT